MSATAPIPASIDRDRVIALTEQMRTVYRERTARSGEYFERASGVMPGGVPSQFQKNDPWPVYIERGTGAQVWDVDGNEYIDYVQGLLPNILGYAHPEVLVSTDWVARGGVGPNRGGRRPHVCVRCPSSSAALNVSMILPTRLPAVTRIAEAHIEYSGSGFGARSAAELRSL